MCRFGLKRAQDDIPLYAQARRVSKGLYEIVLRFPSGNKYGVERFEASTMSQAMERCKRMHPSAVFTRRPR